MQGRGAAISEPTREGGDVSYNLPKFRCETVIDGELGYVLLPVSEELLDDEWACNYARDKARRELWHRCVEQTGQDLPIEEFDALPVWVEYPDRYEIECVGGPHDGQVLTMPGTYPPPQIEMPVDDDIAGLLTAADTPTPSGVRTASYRPLLNDYGFASRAEDGAWRYRYQR